MADVYTDLYTDLYGEEPGVPPGVVTITATVQTGRPTVLLTVENTDDAAVVVRVERSTGIGGLRTIRYLQEQTIQPGASAVALDDEGPLGVPYVYSLYVGTPTFEPAWQEDTTAITHTGPWTVDGKPTYAWLRHLTLPALSRPVLIESDAAHSRHGRQGEFLPLGAGLPVVTASPRGGRRGTLTLLAPTSATADTISDLIEDGSPLQLATDPRYNVRGGGYYLSVGDAEQARWEDDGITDGWTWSLPYVEVAAPPPAGAQGAITTYADLAAAYATYEELLAAAMTNGWVYRDLLTSVT